MAKVCYRKLTIYKFSNYGTDNNTTRSKSYLCDVTLRLWMRHVGTASTTRKHRFCVGESDHHWLRSVSVKSRSLVSSSIIPVVPSKPADQY